MLNRLYIISILILHLRVNQLLNPIIMLVVCSPYYFRFHHSWHQLLFQTMYINDKEID